MFENRRWRLRAVHGLFLLLVLSLTLGAAMPTAFTGDPGVRGGAAGAGGQLAGLTIKESKFSDAGLDAFTEVQSVDGSIPGTEAGLGPRFNLDSCGGCHSQPAIGGSSPAVNPQVAFASKDGGTDQVPFFVRLDGPIREARFQFNRDGTRDGGVHNTATLTGRAGA